MTPATDCQAREATVNVQEGDRVSAGEPLMDGPRNPHDILAVLGEKVRIAPDEPPPPAPPSPEELELQREMDDLTDADYMFRDEGE